MPARGGQPAGSAVGVPRVPLRPSQQGGGRRPRVPGGSGMQGAQGHSGTSPHPSPPQTWGRDPLGWSLAPLCRLKTVSFLPTPPPPPWFLPSAQGVCLLACRLCLGAALSCCEGLGVPPSSLLLGLQDREYTVPAFTVLPHPGPTLRVRDTRARASSCWSRVEGSAPPTRPGRAPTLNSYLPACSHPVPATFCCVAALLQCPL